MEDHIPHTDSYFLKSKEIIKSNGEADVTYAIFMRRPVTYAPKMALSWIKEISKARANEISIKENFKEGSWVGAGEPMLYLSGKISGLIDLETLLLQKLGPACVAAYNAYNMCIEMKNSRFLAMDARHCAGKEMSELMAYGASVGSQKAKRKVNAKGFIGSSQSATAHYFGSKTGQGTMPHALIGYAGSTLNASQLYFKQYPEEPLTVLIDYFGKEISDGLEVCYNFRDLAQEGKLSLRIDTHGGRYVEGLDLPGSYDVLERRAPESIRGYRTENELKNLIGSGVSAASVWYLREKLDQNGFENVTITCSSGFGPEKCRVFALANTPVDVIGTGSFLPQKWSETYATADIISYNGTPRVKVGREFLQP
mgnify:FL=1